MKFLLTATAMLAASVSAGAQDIDPYEGTWGSTGCGDGIQCHIEITKISEVDYGLKFIAAERMDANKVLCSIDADMRRGPMEFTRGHNYDDGLFGHYPDDIVYLAVNVEGDIDLTTSTECDGIVIMNTYGFLGDY